MFVARLNQMSGFLLLLVWANWRLVHSVEDHDQKMNKGISKIKPKVTLCCENPRAIFEYECLTKLSNYTYSPRMNITVEYENNDIQINDFNDFHVVYGIPCENAYAFHPEQYEEDHWKLNKNGSVFIQYNEEYMHPQNYCLHPIMSNTEPYEYTYKLHVCPILFELPTFNKVTAYLMTASIVCMILTTVIYIFMGKRTNHQTLFVVYLIFLSISYSALVLNSFHIGVDRLLTCLPIGYIGYFAVMAAFIVLTVICVSMWNNFRGSNFYGTHLKSNRQLIIGLFCSLGGASLLTSVVVLAEYSSIDKKYKPKIGDQSCWINTIGGFSKYIYLYGPMLLLILVNLVMFVLTTVRIFILKKDVSRVKNSKNSQSTPKQFSFGKEFGLYLRIFFTMGTTWILELINELNNDDRNNNQDLPVFCHIFDVINACQGIIIFVMFGNVQLIYKRFIRAKTANTESSSTQVTAVRQISTSSTASTKPLLRDNV